MQIALTGATGFLGRYLIKHILADGHEVVAWYRSQPNPPDDLPLEQQSRIGWIQGELGNAEASQALVQKVDAVVHSGFAREGDSFQETVTDPVGYWNRNATGTLQLLQAAADAQVSRFVYLSSGAVHDTVLDDRPLDETHPRLPNTLYGACKASAEMLIHHFGKSTSLVTASLRPTSIYGVAQPPEQSKWFELIRDVVDGKDVQATGGSKTVHATDVAGAAMLLIGQSNAVSGQTFNCCDRMISEFEVATLAKEITGSNSKVFGPAKQAKHQIRTERLRALGFQFGGTDKLRETVAELVQSASEKTEF